MGGKDVELFLWSTETGELLSTLRGHETTWTGSNNNTFFVTTQEDSKVGTRADVIACVHACVCVCVCVLCARVVLCSCGREPALVCVCTLAPACAVCVCRRVFTHEESVPAPTPPLDALPLCRWWCGTSRRSSSARCWATQRRCSPAAPSRWMTSTSWSGAWRARCTPGTCARECLAPRLPHLSLHCVRASADAVVLLGFCARMSPPRPCVSLRAGSAGARAVAC